MQETNGTALRREIRKAARYSLKRHYWLFVAATLLAAILGTEYGNATQALRLQKRNLSMQRKSLQMRRKSRQMRRKL